MHQILHVLLKFIILHISPYFNFTLFYSNIDNQFNNKYIQEMFNNLIPKLINLLNKHFNTHNLHINNHNLNHSINNK